MNRTSGFGTLTFAFALGATPLAGAGEQPFDSAGFDAALSGPMLAQESMDDLFDAPEEAAEAEAPAAAADDAGSAESVDDLFGEPEPAAPAAAETAPENASRPCVSAVSIRTNSPTPCPKKATSRSFAIS